MKKFAVVGNPVDHSLSPVIHQQFAEQFEIELDYEKIHVEVGEFLQVVETFRDQGGSGLNVTIPYKSEAYELSAQLSLRAEQARAVNTLTFSEKGIEGDNTDGIGLVTDLVNNHGFEISNKSILILGAGGAVSGVLGPLLHQKPKLIVVANRTLEKAIGLENMFSSLGQVKGCGLDQIEPVEFDLIINGTAASLAGQTPSIAVELVQNAQLAYDMMYAKEPTSFMRWATEKGVGFATDGLGMLVEQAAAAFSMWHQVMPETQTVLDKLRVPS